MKIYTLIFIQLIISISLFAQVEMVSPEHSVYLFLKRMQLEGNIDGYNPSNIPVSRAEIADYLKVLENSKISSEDKKLLGDFVIEFYYDINKNLDNSVSLLSDFKGKNIFDNQKQKYLYAYSDSDKSFFIDLNGNVSQRNSNGDSLGTNSITLGEIGFRVRGTLFNSVGFYLRASNGQMIAGENEDRKFAAATDPKLKGNWRFNTQGENFDTFEGYLRYQTESRWLAITAGREALYQGNGYIDRLYLSNNTVPFDFLKLDLAGGALRYTFFYGSLKGDSLGMVDIRHKTLASHKLDVIFSNKFRVGFWESITVSDNPFSFTFLNPVSFITSADLNTGIFSDNNNALIGFDFEVVPIKNLALQGSIIIDDLKLSTLFSNESETDVNKFGYQAGIIWNNAFTVPTLTAAVEYTRLDPFLYSHWTNKSQYTHWTMPLGHAMQPNSDQFAVKFTYYPYHRLRFDVSYLHQRHAEGFVYDSIGNIVINYGGDINRGGGVRRDFLDGNRINSDMFTFNAVWEPIRQYFIEIKYVYKFQDLVYASKKMNDSWFFITARLDF